MIPGTIEYIGSGWPELVYPELWENCIGAWAPCLGPTGATLYDWSGYGHHGTMSGITPSTAWTVSQRYALAVSNLSAERISVDSTGWSTTRGTACAWVNKTASTAASNDYVIWTHFTSATDRILLEVETYNTNAQGTNPQFTVVFATSGVANNFASNPTVLTLNQWNHVAVTWQAGSPLRLWVNGVNTVSTVNNYTAQSQTSLEYFGNYPTGSLGFGGMLDDMRRYDRVLNANEIALLASRRGIAYDLAPFRIPYSEQVAVGNRRRRFLIGAVSG